MKISHNWLKNHIDFSQSPQEVAELLTQAGLEVSNYACFSYFPKDLVIGHVKELLPHPNADSLRVAKVCIDSGEPRTIVCGASNLKVKQKVLVAPVGCLLPDGENKFYKMTPRKIRGVRSEGMICAKEELGFLGGGPKEIWVLPPHAKEGMRAVDFFSLPDDPIYEIDLTPNRGDATHHLGVARDLSAILSKKRIADVAYKTMIPQSDCSFHLSMPLHSGCGRYASIVLENISVGPSPIWLQARLKALGIASVNALVDASNFVMHDIGQPLHIYDFDAIYQKKLFVKQLEKGTNFLALNGKTYSLKGDELMICDGEKPLAMAGIIGGEVGKVREGTTRILIESAYFDPVLIAKSARYHRIHTDASYRFERGTDIEMPYKALQKVATLIQKIAGGSIASPPLDCYPKKEPLREIALTYASLWEKIGAFIEKEEIHTLLKRLEMPPQDIDEDGFSIFVPHYRQGIQEEADILEEILRIYGYQNIPPKNEFLNVFPKGKGARSFQKKRQLAHFLSGQGFMETKHNSLIKSDYMECIQKGASANNLTLLNPLDGNHNAMAQSLIFSGLASIKRNIDRKITNLHFFELGRCYAFLENQVLEKEMLGLWICGEHLPIRWEKEKKSNRITDLLYTMEQINRSFLGDRSKKIKKIKRAMYADQEALAIVLEGEKECITLGKVSLELALQFGITLPVFFGEVPLSLLKEKETITYQGLSRYPFITRDVSLALPRTLSYQDLLETIWDAKPKWLVAVDLIDRYHDEKLGDKKSYTLRFTFQSEKKTLKESAVALIEQKIIEALRLNWTVTIR